MALEDFVGLFFLFWRLLINLFVTFFQLLWLKIDRHHWLNGVLAIFIFSVCIWNLSIIEQRNHVRERVVIVPVFSSLHLTKPEDKIVTPAQVEELLKFYQSLESQGIKNPDLYINLALLYQAKNETSLAEQYLNQARNLDPNSPLFQ